MEGEPGSLTVITPDTHHPGMEPPQPAHFCTAGSCRYSGAKADELGLPYMALQTDRPSPHSLGSSVLQFLPLLLPKQQPETCHGTEFASSTLPMTPEVCHGSAGTPCTSCCASFHLAESLPQRPVLWCCTAILSRGTWNHLCSLFSPRL